MKVISDSLIFGCPSCQTPQQKKKGAVKLKLDGAND
jgi:hypothetical protein